MNPLPPTAPISYKGGTSLEERMVMRAEQMRKSQKAMLDTFTWESCANCQEWSKSGMRSVPDDTKPNGKRDEQIGPHCMKWNMLPPVEVIAIGCTAWEADIPF